jgi:hypothetical protein
MTLETRTGDAVDEEWLMEVLRANGYDVRLSDSEHGVIKTTHPNRPNVALKIHSETRQISVHHYWKLKKAALRGRGNVIENVNVANYQSCYGKYCIDADDALGVHSYFTLADQVSADDVETFLNNESEDFVEVIAGDSGLMDRIDSPWKSS